MIKFLNFGAWPVRAKMLSGLFVLLALPMVLIPLIGRTTTTNLLFDHYDSNLEYISRAGATSVAANLSTVLNETLNASLDQQLARQVALYAQMMSDPLGVVNATLTNNTITVLNAHLVRHPDFRSIRMLGVDGQLLVSAGNTDAAPSLNEPVQHDHPGYSQIIRSEITLDSPLLLEPYADPISNELVLETASLIVSRDVLLGYLVYTLDPHPILAEPLLAGQPDREASQYLYLLDAEGRLLTPLHGLQPLEHQFTLQSVEDSSAEDSRQTYFQPWNEDEVEVLGRHTVVEPYGWTVVAEVVMQDVGVPAAQQMLLRMLPIAGLIILLSVPIVLIINRQIDIVSNLTRVTEQVAAGNLDVDIHPTRRQDEIGQLQRAIAMMTENLRQSIEILEERVQARTRDLEATSAIAREAAGQEAVEDVLNNTVELIVKNFPAVYHAQVFLIDAQQEYAELVASTGAPGRKLLAAGHRLAVGSVSVIGRVTELGEPVIARDTSTSRVHRKNEFLQETRAEMALPLVYGDRILGALDVQSKLAHAFTPEDQQVFSTLATELAIIINSAQQTAAMQNRLVEMEMQSRALSRADWNQLLAASRRGGYLQAQAGDSAAVMGSEDWSDWQRQAAATKQVVVSPPDPADMVSLAVPIFSQEDEVLGVIEWRVPQGRVSDQTLRMAEQLARRLSNSMETVRLLERSQLLAERERLVNAISGKLTTEPSVAYILDTAVKELSGIMKTSRINIQLKPSSAAVPASGPSENK